MGRQRVHMNEFERVLLRELEEWRGVTMNDIEAKVQKHGKELKKRVQGESPERTGAYRKSWSVRFEGLKTAHYKSLIYNKKHYRLTHLLEHGHAKRDGGRTKAFPHLLKNEEEVGKEFIEDVEKLFE